jgi:hypothetical protein
MPRVSDTLHDLVTLAVAGIALMVGFLLVTYVVSYVLDCWMPATEAIEYHYGSISRKAGLFGLLQTERMRIVKHLFQPVDWHTGATTTSGGSGGITIGNNEACSRVIAQDECIENAANSGGGARDEEAEEKGINPVDSEPPEEDDNVGADTPTFSPAVKKTKAEPEDPSTTPESAQVLVAPLNDAEHERVCSICLTQYQDGCKVMTGTSCRHMFHYDCSVAWLQKHDQCPYCRKDMMTATEMCQAAVEVLGQERVDAMDRARLAALHACQDEAERGGTTAIEVLEDQAASGSGIELLVVAPLEKDVETGECLASLRACQGVTPAAEVVEDYAAAAASGIELPDVAPLGRGVEGP